MCHGRGPGQGAHEQWAESKASLASGCRKKRRDRERVGSEVGGRQGKLRLWQRGEGWG